MPTENGLLIDIAEFTSAIEAADVFAVGFRHFPERLLVDTRSSETDGPLVVVVEPLKSAAERFFWLGQQRPSFGMPERFMFVPWPHSISFLEESGVWSHLSQIILDAGHAESQAMLDRVRSELRRRDDEANLAAIRSEGYRQIWPKG